MLNLFWVWVGFGLIGAGLALGVRFALDRQVDEDRRVPVKGCQRLLRKLRVQGLAEEAIRQFVAKYAGRHWEAFFEALFGFEAKLAARALLLRGGYAGEREKHAAWREPVLALIDRVDKGRREAQERGVLIATEQARLVADGMGKWSARRQAERRADELVRRANAIRSAESKRRLQGVTDPAPENIGLLIAAEPPRPEPDAPMHFLAWLWLGPHVRLVLAVVLMAGCAAWAVQNAVFGEDLGGLSVSGLKESVRRGTATQPLAIAGVPEQYTAWCDTVNVGWAGVLLLASLYYRGHRAAVLVLVGAGVAVFGHRCGIRTVEPIRDYHVALMLGTVLCLVGFRFGRR
jgi:hypothetical protein